ncbi:hypothetical protein AB0I72_02045 [Nocardiopsis sp. NPDC049922]|uniref:hypothetical protein n=1 Tax=Nocardiopsis sp. NPDC049922 TaxID=3155157 RepID=UPI00340AD267
MPLLADRPAPSAPSTPATVPAPRHHDQDPNAWVAKLCPTQQALALALSDMPQSDADRQAALGKLLPPVFPTRPGGEVIPPRLDPAGVRVINAWVAQGVKRAGGELALWHDGEVCRSLNLTGGWRTRQGRAFAKRFGGKRRINAAESQAWHAPQSVDLVDVWVPLRDAFIPVHDQLEGLHPAKKSDPDHLRTRAIVYTMRAHEAGLLATWFGRALTHRPDTGLTLE